MSITHVGPLLFAAVAIAILSIGLMFTGIIILRVVSKVRVDITLDDHDLEALNMDQEVAVTTNSVHTTLRRKEQS